MPEVPPTKPDSNTTLVPTKQPSEWLAIKICQLLFVLLEKQFTNVFFFNSSVEIYTGFSYSNIRMFLRFMSN